MKFRVLRAAAVGACLPRIAAAVAVAALAAGLVPQAAAADDEADALLAKHKAYVGWRAGDGTIKTLRETGTVSRDGKVYDHVTTLLYGIAYRSSSQDRQGLTADDGFTGSVFWTSSMNGFTVRPLGESVRPLISEQAVFSEFTGDQAAKLVRNEKVGDVNAAVLRLTSKYGLPIDVYVDRANGAYVRVVIDPDGRYEETINGIGYKEVGGKRFMASWHYGHSKYVYAYETIDINPAIQPDDLRPPEPSATWTFGGDSVPVTLDDKATFPRLYVDLVVNGVKGKFILDTGASHTLVVDSFARRVGGKRVGATRIGGIAGSAAANVFTFDAVAFGGSTLRHLIVTSGLDEEFVQQDGVVGLIGFDLLAGAIVDLDLDAKQLRILDPAAVQPDQTHDLVLHPDLTTHHMRVPMKLNGKYDVLATLDSGNPLNVLFSADLIKVERMPFFVDPTDLGSTRYGGGVTGATEVEHCGKLQSLELGPVNYRPVPACDSPSFDRNEILVGLDFMKNFNYTFDYPEGIVVLHPRKH